MLRASANGEGAGAEMPSSEPPERGKKQLRFRPIELSRHAALAIEFRRDSYVCSFGTDQIFVEENGADGRGYLEWLQERLLRFPEGHVHAWQGDEIVGQVELLIGAQGGYVNLFYLRPDARGRGLGDELHDYAVSVFQRRGVRVAGLSVSPTNVRAVRYYERHGWKDVGPRPGVPSVHELELAIPPLAGPAASAAPVLGKRRR